MSDPTSPRSIQISGLALAFPQSLAVYGTYEEAQRAVDHLADAQFPVENCMIVGTDLKQVERITGRLTWGRVALAGPPRACGWACWSACCSACSSRRAAGGR
ncbi:general stress protein [Nocardioides houyundeii]|uniref:general stress protein n=1 Tax=Nocardioides houyundeii TaxID=2045452 RepID=UPI0030D3C476